MKWNERMSTRCDKERERNKNGEMASVYMCVLYEIAFMNFISLEKIKLQQHISE